MPINGKKRPSGMHVLIITQYFWPENFRINDLALSLFDRGFQVTVLTGIPNYPDGHFFPGYDIQHNRMEKYHGIKVIRVPLIPRGKAGGFRLSLNYLSFAFCASVWGPLLCREKADVIFVYEPSPITVGLPAIVMKKVKLAPIMFWVQDLWPESLTATGAVKSKHILHAVEKMARFIYKGCDRILVQSEAFFKPLEKLGIATEKIYYFPNSAEEFYKPLAPEAEGPERVTMPEGFRVVFAGNIGAAQNFETILTAATLLKDYGDIHWIIIGDGRMRLWVEGEVKKRHLMQTFHLLGKYPVKSMPRYFSLADVLLATLKKDPIFSLTIPSKIQSYMACGRPIIAAIDGEGARVIREAGAGITCPAENPRALADALLSLYRMPMPEREAMGMRGRDYFETNFNHTKLMDRLELWMKALKYR